MKKFFSICAIAMALASCTNTQDTTAATETADNAATDTTSVAVDEAVDVVDEAVVEIDSIAE